MAGRVAVPFCEFECEIHWNLIVNASRILASLSRRHSKADVYGPYVAQSEARVATNGSAESLAYI